MKVGNGNHLSAEPEETVIEEPTQTMEPTPDQAVEIVRADRMRRERECVAAIEATLARFQCVLDPLVVISRRGFEVLDYRITAK